MRKLLFTLIVLFTVSSTYAQSKPAKQRADTTVYPEMTWETWRYFQSLGREYLAAEALPTEVREHKNPVNMTNPAYASMTSTASTSGGTGKRELGVRQTIVFDSRGNSHLITTVRVR